MVNKHIPMIKFRRTTAGSHEHGQFTLILIVELVFPFKYLANFVTGSVLQPLVGTTKPMNSEMSSKKTMLAASLEDWQLTGKYRRKPMSQEEIDYINVSPSFYVTY